MLGLSVSKIAGAGQYLNKGVFDCRVLLIAKALVKTVMMKTAIFSLRMRAADAASVLLCVMLPDSLSPSCEARD